MALAHQVNAELPAEIERHYKRLPLACELKLWHTFLSHQTYDCKVTDDTGAVSAGSERYFYTDLFKSSLWLTCNVKVVENSASGQDIVCLVRQEWERFQRSHSRQKTMRSIGKVEMRETWTLLGGHWQIRARHILHRAFTPPVVK